MSFEAEANTPIQYEIDFADPDALPLPLAIWGIFPNLPRTVYPELPKQVREPPGPSTRALQFDMTGQTFGELTAESYLPGKGWDCVCTCGNRRVVEGSHLRSGKYDRCRNCADALGAQKRASHHRPRTRQDLTGSDVGTVHVVRETEGRPNYWDAECLVSRGGCGSVKSYQAHRIIARTVVSCGCFEVAKRRKRHQMKMAARDRLRAQQAAQEGPCVTVVGDVKEVG